MVNVDDDLKAELAALSGPGSIWRTLKWRFLTVWAGLRGKPTPGELFLLHCLTNRRRARLERPLVQPGDGPFRTGGDPSARDQLLEELENYFHDMARERLVSSKRSHIQERTVHHCFGEFVAYDSAASYTARLRISLLGSHTSLTEAHKRRRSAQ